MATPEVKNAVEVKTETPEQKMNKIFDGVKEMKDFLIKDEKGVDRKMSILKGRFPAGTSNEAILIYTLMTPEEQKALKDQNAKMEGHPNLGPLESSAMKITAYFRDGKTISTQSYERATQNTVETDVFKMKQPPQSFMAPVEYSNYGLPAQISTPKQVDLAIANIQQTESLGTRYFAEQNAKKNQELQNQTNQITQQDKKSADQKLDTQLASL